MYYLILLSIIIVCCGVIAWLLKRGMKHIKLVEMDAILKEKQAEVKKKLIEIKLKKKLFNLEQLLLVVAKKILVKVRVNFKKEGKTFLKQEQEGVITKRKLNTKSLAESKLLEAKVFLKKRQIDAAEDKLIEVLQLEPKNVAAYMSLGDIYTMRRDWQTAEEAYRHIIKIKPGFFDGYRELASVFQAAKKWSELKALAEEVLSLGHNEVWVYVSLGIADRKSGYPDKAEEYFKQAVEIEPQNEKLLDSLLEVAIINKNKQLAQKAFNTLAGISQDEMKLQDYRNKIEIL